jgi:hypothetical protein
MNYEKPQVVDYGDLVELTAAAGALLSEDGIGKTVQVGVGDIIDVSVGLFP